MIDPSNPVHRQRLARASENDFQTLMRFARMRKSTVQAYLGMSQFGPNFDMLGGMDPKYKKHLPKGNLLQQSGISFQVALAYGEPEYLCTSRGPKNVGLAERLGPALNRLACLLNLGEIAREVAADSFFGYGIFKVGVGRMTPGARAATGMEHGPCVWKVSQADFLYDTQAKAWDQCAYIGDIYTMPLNEAQEEYPQHADRLGQMTDSDRLDAPIVMPRSTSTHAAELEVQLIDIYFPAAQIICTWPIHNATFGQIGDEPLVYRDYTGHWSGLYQVLTHLYSPDELVPVSQAESTKSLHFLFQDLLELTSAQARLAKINPIHTAAADKDMQRILNASDRTPVSVGSISPDRFSVWENPGPSQSQTAFMAGVRQMFKEFSNTLDDPQRAPTATQGNLIRQTTNAMIAEARRKFMRVLQLVGYKLGDLLIDSELTIPLTMPLSPGSDVNVDITWLPQSLEPRSTKIDDYELKIEPQSIIYESYEEKLTKLTTISQQLIPLFQARAMGFPINLEKVLNTFKDYAHLPELAEWYEELFPEYAVQGQAGRMTAPRVGTGHYVRENVSAKTDEGAIEVNMAQQSDDSGGGVRFE